jgi:hypothetical protein
MRIAFLKSLFTGGTATVDWHQPSADSHIFDHPYNSQKIELDGERFPVRTYHLSQKDYHRLGLNPAYYLAGLKASLVHRRDYERFCAAARLKGERVGGAYPLTNRNVLVREEELVTTGVLDYLPPSSRQMVLPDNFSRGALLHQTLHDIYWGGAISPEGRKDFCRLMLLVTLHLINHSINEQKQSYPLIFLQKVGLACNPPYDIMELGLSLDFDRPTREQKIYAGESFAFVGERYISDKKFGPAVLPPNIVDYFKKSQLKVW